MKSFVLILFTLGLLQATQAQESFQILEHDPRIRYQQDQPEVLEESAKGVWQRRGGADWMTDSVAVGPFLLNYLQDRRVLTGQMGKTSLNSIPVGDRLLITESRILTAEPSLQALSKAAGDIVGDTPVFRRIRNEELRLLWSLIPFDLRDPLVVVEGEGHVLVMITHESKVLMIEKLCNPTLVALAALPTSKTDQDVLGPKLDLTAGAHYLQRENWDKAVRHFGRSADFAKDEETTKKALMGLCIALVQIEDYTASQERLSQLLEQNPDAGEFRLLRAQVYLHQGLNDLAKSDLEFLSKSGSRELYPEVLFQLGNLDLTKQKFDSAVKIFEECLELQPDFVGAQLNLATALGGLGRHQEAVKRYSTLLNKNPDWPEALNNRGYYLARLGRYDEAMIDIEKSLRLDPDDTATLDSKAYILVGMSRHEEAIQIYDSILKAAPKSPKALFGRGVAWKHLGELEKAKADMKEARKIDPNVKVEWP